MAKYTLKGYLKVSFSSDKTVAKFEIWDATEGRDESNAVVFFLKDFPTVDNLTIADLAKSDENVLKLFKITTLKTNENVNPYWDLRVGVKAVDANGKEFKLCDETHRLVATTVPEDVNVQYRQVVIKVKKWLETKQVKLYPSEEDSLLRAITDNQITSWNSDSKSDLQIIKLGTNKGKPVLTVKNTIIWLNEQAKKDINVNANASLLKGYQIDNAKECLTKLTDIFNGATMDTSASGKYQVDDNTKQHLQNISKEINKFIIFLSRQENDGKKFLFDSLQVKEEDAINEDDLKFKNDIK